MSSVLVVDILRPSCQTNVTNFKTKCSSAHTAGSNPNLKWIQPQRIAAKRQNISHGENLDDNFESMACDKNDVDTQNLTIPRPPRKKVEKEKNPFDC